MRSRTRILTLVTALATMLATAAPAVAATDPEMMTSFGDWEYTELFTVGEYVDDYLPPGILDGLAAYDNGDTVKVLASHEFRVGSGYDYSLASGAVLDGARISYFEIDPDTLEVVESGLAYDTIYNRDGEIVEHASDLDEGGLARFCSAQGYAAGEYGFVDDIYFTGEETNNGTQFALDVEEGELWALPDLGRANWENVTAIDTGRDDLVGLIVGDDYAPAPAYLYLGEKQPDGNFVERNGLSGGQLYYWDAQGSAQTPADFFGTGSVSKGKFVPIDVKDSTGAYKDAGDPFDGTGLRGEVFDNGGFIFSRPEDVHTNPADGSQVVLASTGRPALFGGADTWGVTYVIDVQVPGKALGNRDKVDATATIAYDGNETGDFGIRSQDNLVWATDGSIYIQEDRAVSSSLFGAASGEEASIWALDPVTGAAERIAQIDRSAIPDGQEDVDPTDLGDWESSGILDVTHLFDLGDGLVLLGDVQPHSLRGEGQGGGFVVDGKDLVQGGQLFLLYED